MLNGKFYTGLTPKMMERNAGSQNRLESHLFWPDDSKTESANDTRLKRRTSFQASSPRDTASFQRQSSWCGGENAVDTKQRFHKEFANSSIQFCDNIQEEDTGSGRQQAIRKPLLRKTLKQDIAVKPTAMNMKLPSSDTAQEEYGANRKSQAFSSKIQFYDYNDDNERRNNKLRPRLDMNDKKDVERNTKNSPKLQVKGIARNLRLVDEQRNNDRIQRERIVPVRSYEHFDEDDPPRNETHVIRNEVRAEQRNNNGRFGGRNDRYMRSDSPDRSYSQQNEYSYNDDMPDFDDFQQQSIERHATPRAQSGPKRILKNSVKDEHDFEEQRGTNNDLEYVERGARNMRIHTSHNGNGYADDNTNFREQRARPQEDMGTGSTVRYTYSSRNEMKSTNRPAAGNNQRQHQNRPNVPDYEANAVIDDEERCSNDRMAGNNASKKSLSFNRNNNNNNNNNINKKSSIKMNNLNQQQQQKQEKRRLTPKITTSSMALASNDSPTSDVKKHLRSSLCFSGGEIVANNRAEAGSGTPTSEPGSRRTARSAATTRRICVGLPD